MVQQLIVIRPVLRQVESGRGPAREDHVERDQVRGDQRERQRHAELAGAPGGHISGRDPGLDFDVILGELKEFSGSLLEKPMIVVASKIDACQDLSRIEAVRSRAEEHGLEFHAISSVTGTAIEELRYAINDRLFANEENARIAIGS